MPRIPLHHFAPGATTPSNVRVDPKLMAPLHAANANIGKAVANVGDVMAEVGIQVQQAQNYRKLSEMDVAMQDAWTEYQNGINPSDDESKWLPGWQQKLKSTVAKFKPESAGQALQDQMVSRSERFRAMTERDISTQAKAAGINKARIAGEAKVALAWQNGDEQGAISELNTMADLGVIYRETIDGEVAKGREFMARSFATNDLNELRNLPPAQAKAAMRQYAKDVTATGEDGKPVNYENLSLADRLKLQDQAEYRAREAQQALDVNGRRLVGEMRMGRATLETLTAAVASGEIDEETARAIRPDIDVALGDYAERKAEKERIARERLETDERQARGDARSRLSKFESMRADIAPSGKAGSVSVADIDRALQLEQIDAKQAAELKQRLQSASASEQVFVPGGIYAGLSEDVRALVGRRLFGGEPSEEEFRRMLVDITNAKLSQPSRLKLVDELLQARLVDFNNMEEDAADSWMDRKISTQERDLRRDIISELRQQAPNVGDLGTGDLFFAQEARIRGFFDSAKGGQRSKGEIDAFKQQLRTEIQEAAGSVILRDVFDF